MPGSNESQPLLEDGKELVEFAENDAEDPMNWSFGYKVWTTTLFSLTTLGCTFTSSVFSSAQEDVAKEFNLTILVATLGTSLYGMTNQFLRKQVSVYSIIKFWRMPSDRWLSRRHQSFWVGRDRS